MTTETTENIVPLSSLQEGDIIRIFETERDGDDSPVWDGVTWVSKTVYDLTLKAVVPYGSGIRVESTRGGKIMLYGDEGERADYYAELIERPAVVVEDVLAAEVGDTVTLEAKRNNDITGEVTFKVAGTWESEDGLYRCWSSRSELFWEDWWTLVKVEKSNG